VLVTIQWSNDEVSRINSLFTEMYIQCYTLKYVIWVRNTTTRLGEKATLKSLPKPLLKTRNTNVLLQGTKHNIVAYTDIVEEVNVYSTREFCTGRRYIYAVVYSALRRVTFVDVAF
jgi:hypothetical protein